MRDSDYKEFEASVLDLAKKCHVKNSVGKNGKPGQYGYYDITFLNQGVYYDGDVLLSEQEKIKKIYEKLPLQKYGIYRGYGEVSGISIKDLISDKALQSKSKKLIEIQCATAEIFLNLSEGLGLAFITKNPEGNRVTGVRLSSDFMKELEERKRANKGR